MTFRFPDFTQQIRVILSNYGPLYVQGILCSKSGRSKVSTHLCHGTYTRQGTSLSSKWHEPSKSNLTLSSFVCCLSIPPWPVVCWSIRGTVAEHTLIHDYVTGRRATNKRNLNRGIGCEVTSCSTYNAKVTPQGRVFHKLIGTSTKSN